MMEHLLTIEGLCKRFAGVTALADFSCAVDRREIVGLIGPNGAGKTTFFDIVSGFLTPDRGTIRFRGFDLRRRSPDEIASLGISRTFQVLRLIGRMSVLENVLLSFPDQPGERLANVLFHAKAVRRSEAAHRQRAISLLAKVDLADQAKVSASALSYGQQKLLSLACCMARNSRLLFLDEPVAGIAPHLIGKVLTLIRDQVEQDRSVIVIEHDMEAIEQICERLIFMDAGAKICEGSPQAVRNDPRVIDAYLE